MLKLTFVYVFFGSFQQFQGRRLMMGRYMAFSQKVFIQKMYTA